MVLDLLVKLHHLHPIDPRQGIPVAFVVDRNGRVVWIGHPMAELEPVLKAVVEDRFTLGHAAALEQARPLWRELNQRTQMGNESAAQKTFEQLAALNEQADGLVFHGREFAVFADYWALVRIERLGSELLLALRRGADEAELDAKCNAIRELAPAGFDVERYLEKVHQAAASGADR